MNSTCNFFQWADENDNQNTDWSNSVVNRGKNKTHSRGGSVSKRPRLTGSKRKCGNCGMEGKILRLLYLSGSYIFTQFSKIVTFYCN